MARSEGFEPPYRNVFQGGVEDRCLSPLGYERTEISGSPDRNCTCTLSRIVLSYLCLLFHHGTTEYEYYTYLVIRVKFLHPTSSLHIFLKPFNDPSTFIKYRNPLSVILRVINHFIYLRNCISTPNCQ